MIIILAIYHGPFADLRTPPNYPEQGKVIATRIVERPHETSVHSDDKDQTHEGGRSAIRELPVYRIETDTKFYELEGTKKQVWIFGDSIQFRVEEEWVYFQQGDKEEKVRMVGVELKQSH